MKRRCIILLIACFSYNIQEKGKEQYFTKKKYVATPVPSFEPGEPSQPDFVGWTGIGPIAFLIEQILGINIDASKNRVVWRISRSDEYGIEKLKMGNF